jgi:hypothetical protein
MRRLPVVTMLLTALLLVVACKPVDQGGFVVTSGGPASSDAGGGASQGTASVTPVIISSQLAVGDNRVVFSFVDPTSGLPIGSPDVPAAISFIAPGTTQATTPVQAEFVWAIEGSRGEYIAHAAFPVAGQWTAVFDVTPKGGQPEAIGIPFTVLLKRTVISVGDKAPDTRTPTLADVGGDIRQISSDAHPDPAFYQVSVDAALAQHTPFILVFATPAFCRSGQCGPTLDQVKAARATAPPSVAFINVEPYKLTYADGRLQPVLDAQNNLIPTEVSNAWGLPTEPWIFAVDRNGIVQGSFEGIITPQELSDVIAKIAGS